MERSREFLAAVTGGESGRVRELLAAEPTLARTIGENGVSALLIALYHGHQEIAALLAGAASELSVWEAAALGDTAALRSLLAAEPALANAVAPDGFAPLGLAAFFGCQEALALLLAAGADPNAPAANPSGVRPLHSAAAHRGAEAALATVRALVRAGADVNVAQRGGYTPLHQAAAHDRREMIHFLLAHGADRAARSDDGKTPGDLALERELWEAAAMLQR